MLQTGTHLHDRYRVLRRIGRGGMGAVYEAVDTRLRNTVAVKQLELAGAAADRAFEREAQLLAGLRHPALPVVIDYFLAAADAFLVMQYIEGEDLAHHLERLQQPCDRDEVVAWGCAILSGLAYIHSHQPPIVHRDIKPANVKRTPTGEVVLLDFGLAKGRLDDDETDSSGSNSMYGFTLQYAPPEQIDKQGTDERSDLFALGATLYHLATGVQPASALHRSLAVKNGMPDPLVPADEIYPAVGPVLSAALTKALQLAPNDRFASAAEMHAALSALGAPEVPRAEPTTAERRVDAALPTQVEVGRQTDLIVQVRFADSPRLGIEDWPTARRPEHVEQQSEPLHVKHNIDVTGRLLPARVRIRVVAADFTIEGDAERVIEVPVNDYSKRMTFLLTSQRAGYCRVNVEVYALDTLFLGAVAVEAEAVSTHVAEAMPNAANVVLGTFARRTPTPKPAARGTSATADTVRIKITPELAAALAEPPAPAPAQQEPTAATIVAMPSPVADSPPPLSVAAPPQPQPPPPQAPPAPPTMARPTPAPPAPAPLAVPPPVLAPAATPQAAQKRSLSGRITALGGAVAAVVIAGVVVITWPAMRRSVTEPIVESPPMASAPTTSTPTPSPALPTPEPATAPPKVAPNVAPPPEPATRPRPPVAAAPPPVTTGAVPRPAPPPVATGASPSPAAPPPPPPAPPPSAAPPAPPAAAPPSAAPPPPAAAAPPSAAPPPPPAAAPPSAAPPTPPAAAPPSAAAPPPPAAVAPAPNAAGSSSAKSLEAARQLEQSGELAQALTEYERARQLLEADVARLNEALQSGLVTRRRIEAAEAALNDAKQSITRVRARLDAQRRRK